MNFLLSTKNFFGKIRDFLLSIFLNKKKVRFVDLNRFDGNPILTPNKENNWEAWQTFNPSAVLIDDKVHFLYRAIGEDAVSRFGYAVSSDGMNIDKRLSYPVYTHEGNDSSSSMFSISSGGSFNGAEDPRMVRVGDEDLLYLTYTACEDGLRVGLSAIEIEKFLNQKWHWKKPDLISPPNEVHKNWVIFPEKISGQYAIIHSINPTIQIEYRDSLEFEEGDHISSFYGGLEEDGCWDKLLRGAGPPPIKTKDGWLLLYHAMGDDKSQYKVGAMLLDLQDPSVVLHRSKGPVLKPEEHYENSGFKPGVVYVSGAVKKDGKLMVYYGCSDNYVGVAYAPMDDFLDSIKHGAEPRFTNKDLNLN